jgi:ATP-dependent DNA helicase DinG
MTYLPPPSTYGLPDRYSSWRPNQAEAVCRAIETDKRFVAIVAPTGFGKTITGATIGKFAGRTLYNVETKALMDQITGDMREVVYDIKGKGNYDCRLLLEENVPPARAKCDRAEGRCSFCPYYERGCDYYDRFRKAQLHQFVLTNYSYDLAISTYGKDDLGNFDVQINDEAHGIENQICSFMRIELEDKETQSLLNESLPAKLDLDGWQKWAAARVGAIRARADALRIALSISQSSEVARDLREVSQLQSKLEQISRGLGGWVEDRDWRRKNEMVAFEPVWPARYTHHLFRATPKVILMSATIRPKTMEILGLQPEQYDFLEYPSAFPIARRPIIYIPTVQQRSTMTDGQRLEAVRRIDQIIDQRLDRKGAVFTVSFERAEHLMQHSRHRGRMILTKGKWGGLSTADIIDRFKQLPDRSGAILVGPNFTTGVDFPYTEVEYQIIMKVPFPDTRSPVMKARCDEDPDYRNYVAMVSVVQSAGRGMRAADDFCETLIVDDQWTWFFRNNQRHAPQWFNRACQFRPTIPPPPPKLEKRS